MGSAPSRTPWDWPSSIEASRDMFQNFSTEIRAGDVLIAFPKTADECIRICAWARANKFKVRPCGTRYSWSPLVVDNNRATATKKVVIVDTTKYMNAVTSVDVERKVFTMSSGALISTALNTLAQHGLSLSTTSGNGNMCLGGAFATATRGWACKPSAQHAAATEVPGTVYGTMTNSVLSLKAVVWDGETFAVREFTRSNPEDALVFIAVGRMLVVEYTVRAVDDYNMRVVSTTDIPASIIFATPKGPPGSPPPANSFADIVDRYGRISALFIPYTDAVWTRYGSYCPTAPPTSRVVTGPYNYPFQDSMLPWMNPIIETILGVPNESLLERIADAIEDPVTKGVRGLLGNIGAAWTKVVNEFKSVTGIEAAGESLTPHFAKLQAAAMAKGNEESNAQDLWGPSRFQLMYAQSKVQVTSWAITIALKRCDMQLAAAMFFQVLQGKLAEYEKAKRYPVNLTVEFRASGLDDGEQVGVLTSLPLSPLFHDPSTDYDAAVMIDVVTFPGTSCFGQFANEMMQELRQKLVGMRLMGEWSKGFAYGSNGAPWDDEEELRNIRQSLPLWNAVRDRFAQLDPDEMFVDAFTRKVFAVAQN